MDSCACKHRHQKCNWPRPKLDCYSRFRCINRYGIESCGLLPTKVTRNPPPESTGSVRNGGKKERDPCPFFLTVQGAKETWYPGIIGPMAHDIDVGSFVTSIFFPPSRCLGLERVQSGLTFHRFSVCSFVMRNFCSGNRYI
jgi:hypothetical protein